MPLNTERLLNESRHYADFTLAGPTKDSKTRYQSSETLREVVPELSQLSDSFRTRLCSCFYPPSFLQVFRSYLDQPINTMTFDELSQMYRAYAVNQVLEPKVSQKLGMLLAGELLFYRKPKIKGLLFAGKDDSQHGSILKEFLALVPADMQDQRVFIELKAELKMMGVSLKL
ncbi:MAG: hypothetical protein K0S29_17 [Gammaproteobacteria bacterium]|jgi:hypothetical protein|nr:hypothetical protein [Gammaproteobacteria bacterium]